MVAKQEFAAKCAMAAIAIGWFFVPRPQAAGLAPDNAQVLLDHRNKRWISPPCLLTDNFEAATRDRIDEFMDEEHAFTGRNQWSLREIVAHGVLEMSTMGEAYALQKKDRKWRPDDLSVSALATRRAGAQAWRAGVSGSTSGTASALNSWDGRRDRRRRSAGRVELVTS